MKFLRYTGKRMLHLIPVLLGITLMAFLLGIFSPGDPARMALSQGVNEPTEQEIQKKREELGLDQPVYIQYFRWINNAVQGDLGTSYLTRKPIKEELIRRAPVTLKVALFSVLLTALSGIACGVFMARRKRGILYRLLNIGCTGAISIPGFCISLFLIWLFSENLRILPTSGAESWKSFVMPTVALSLPSAGAVARLMESSLQKEMSRPYVIAAYSKGFSDRYVSVMHALRNSLIPVITMLGNYLGGILGGAAVIESIFSLPGLGSYALTSISGRDYPALQGYVLITGFVFVSIHFVVDIISYGLNPQIELEADR